MAFCPNCGNQIPDGAPFCAACGAPATAQQSRIVVQDPRDHTAEFTAEDISKNKVIAMAAYILGIFGIIIALLAAPESPYASFHSRQCLKIEILNILLAVITVVLGITVIVPIAGAIGMVILFVVRIICFFQVCKGRAKEAPIISSFGFLK